MEIVRVKDAGFEEMKSEYPEVLYKYRDFADAYHKKVLTNRQLYYSAPSGFEDPKDCKIPVRFDLLTKKQRIKWIEYKLRENIPNKARAYYRQQARETYKTSPLSNNEELKQYQEETFKQYDERAGILSLTGNPNNEKMWDKYANKHTGFCVGFDPLILFQHLGGGGKVDYVDKLPEIFPHPIHSYEKQMVSQIYSKEKKWFFEEEYRTGTFRDYPMSQKDRIITVPPEGFRIIIIGKNMPNNLYEELVGSLPPELKNVPINRLGYHLSHP